MSRYERIETTLRAAFTPTILDVVDESFKHADHVAANGLGSNVETHFAVTMVTDGFAGLSRLARQRAVNEVLAGEFSSGLHALSLNLKTPSE